MIPIVFALAADPVGTGLVASLARPGGNVTGLSLQVSDLAVSDLTFARGRARASPIGDPGQCRQPGSVLEMSETEVAARTLGLEVVRLEIRRSEDIGPAIDALKGSAEALYVASDPLITATEFGLTPWRWARDCPRFAAYGSSSKWEC